MFLPYAKARKVSEVTLFSNQGVNGNLHITLCQWPGGGGGGRLVVYGCQSQESDLPDGLSPASSVHCYLTVTTAPSLNNCKDCVKVASSYDADDVAAAWNSCVRLSCLRHGLTVHTQFDLVPPYPKFEPRISLKRDNAVVINTGNFLHAVTVDMERPRYDGSGGREVQPTAAAVKTALVSKMTVGGLMSDLLTPIEVNVGVAEFTMSGCRVVGGSPPNFCGSPASIVPTSDSENTDAESEASIDHSVCIF